MEVRKENLPEKRKQRSKRENATTTAIAITATEAWSAPAGLDTCAGAKRMPMALTVIANHTTVVKTKTGKRDGENADVIENMVMIAITVTTASFPPAGHVMCAGVKETPMGRTAIVNRTTVEILIPI